MYRIVKANGWNRYKVQKRVLFMFWNDVPACNFHSKHIAQQCCAKLIREGKA